MKNDYTKKDGFAKMILLYIAIVVAIFGLTYYFFLLRNPQAQDNQSSINIGVVPQDKILNLSNQGLTSIPSYVFNRADLEELNVSHNSLTGAIQSQIGKLKNLKIIDASYNQMTGVPAEVGQLQKLQILDLSYNQLTGLPYELGNLSNLKTLNLSGNSYSQQDLDYIRDKLPPTVNIIVNQ